MCALFSRVFRTYWWVTRLKFTEDLYFANLSRYFLSLWNNDRWRTPHRSMWAGDGNLKLPIHSYSIHLLWTIHRVGFPAGSVIRNPPVNAGDTALFPGSGRSPGEGNGNPLQDSCLRNSMDRGAWQATVHGLKKKKKKKIGQDLATRQQQPKNNYLCAKPHVELWGHTSCQNGPDFVLMKLEYVFIQFSLIQGAWGKQFLCPSYNTYNISQNFMVIL